MMSMKGTSYTRNIVGATSLHNVSSVGSGYKIDKRVGQFGVPNGVKSLGSSAKLMIRGRVSLERLL